MADRPREILGFRGDDRSDPLDIYSCGCAAQGELDVKVDDLIGGQVQSATLVSVKSGATDADLVTAKIEVWHVEDTSRASDNASRCSSAFVYDLDFGVGYKSGRRIC